MYVVLLITLIHIWLIRSSNSFSLLLIRLFFENCHTREHLLRDISFGFLGSPEPSWVGGHNEVSKEFLVSVSVSTHSAFAFVRYTSADRLPRNRGPRNGPCQSLSGYHSVSRGRPSTLPSFRLCRSARDLLSRRRRKINSELRFRPNDQRQVGRPQLFFNFRILFFWDPYLLQWPAVKAT